MKLTSPLTCRRNLSISLRIAFYCPIIALCLLIFVPMMPAGFFGRQAANEDIKKELYAVYLKKWPWADKTAELLHQRYRIDAKIYLGGSLTSNMEKSYREEYNRTQMKAFSNLWSYDVVKECSDEAEASWRAEVERKKNR